MTMTETARQCRGCKEEKVIDAFPLRSHSNGRSRSRLCRTCHSLRRRLLKRKISAEELKQMMREQQGRCYICGSQEPLQIDHHHESGRVRKLLCNTCNWRVGMLETIGNLTPYLKYIEDL